MITTDDFYNEVKECTYKGEVYSVRDNGAVMRHSREGMRLRKLDNIWTFGNNDIRTGYMIIGTERVHRIVAYAFIGEPPTEKHVVDHIDTNRQNNRPENLRWLTRLENALNNTITRARIENICGSIEAFIENPSILSGHEKVDPNFKWMRTVSPAEAKASYRRLLKWAEKRPKSKGGKLGEWIYQESKQSIAINEMFDIFKKQAVVDEYDSLTPNVVQVNWKTPTKFPLCPQETYEKPLEEYKKRLLHGQVFCTNQYNDSIVLDSDLVDNGKALYIMCRSCNEQVIKPWSLIEVRYKNELYYHKSIQTYFYEDGAKKYFTIAKGEEWTGGDVFDDYC